MNAAGSRGISLESPQASRRIKTARELSFPTSQPQRVADDDQIGQGPHAPAHQGCRSSKPLPIVEETRSRTHGLVTLNHPDTLSGRGGIVTTIRSRSAIFRAIAGVIDDSDIFRGVRALL